MSNPPRAKGTSGETELLRIFHAAGFKDMVRNPAGARTDLSHRAEDMLAPIVILAVRPDRGRWLVTMTLEQFFEVVDPGVDVEVEVKRFARFHANTLFEKELGDLV